MSRLVACLKRISFLLSLRNIHVLTKYYLQRSFMSIEGEDAIMNTFVGLPALTYYLLAAVYLCVYVFMCS